MPKPELDGGRSDPFDGNPMCMGRERLEVIGIRRQYCASGLRGSHHQRVHRGTSANMPAEKRCSSCETLPDVLDNVAGLQQSVFSSVAPSVALKALDQHNRGNPRWPQAFLTKRKEQSCCRS
jgi:hypothetical protein